jgi:hypothetical protein
LKLLAVSSECIPNFQEFSALKGVLAVGGRKDAKTEKVCKVEKSFFSWEEVVWARI